MITLLLFISAGINVGVIGGWITQNIIRNKAQKAPVISPIVQNLLDSLEKDVGWEYLPANLQKNTASGYFNEKIGIHFSLDPSLKGGERVYSPFCHVFSKDEIEMIKKSVEQANARKFLDLRLKALDAHLEEDFLSLDKKASQLNSDLKAILGSDSEDSESIKNFLEKCTSKKKRSKKSKDKV